MTSYYTISFPRLQQKTAVRKIFTILYFSLALQAFDSRVIIGFTILSRKGEIVMRNKILILGLLAVLLLCLLPVLVFTIREGPPATATPIEEVLPVPPSPNSDDPKAAEHLAGLIQPDAPVAPAVVIPGTIPSPAQEPVSVTVSADEVLYAYEGMLVENNSGTVYSTGAEVQNNGGTVYSNGGIVHNNGGVVYAKGGTVYNDGGTVYNDGAEVLVLDHNSSYESFVFGYYELKLAGYYEPYVTLEGVTTEPGSEMMIISEDTVCRITPKEGFRISDAESSFGDLLWGEDGSVSLVNVNGDTTLTLEIETLS